MTVEEAIQSLVERFNRHVEQTPAMAEELQGLSRTIVIRLTDAGSYSVDLSAGRLRTCGAGRPPGPT